MAEAPVFQDAPGVKVRARRDGTFAVYWQCRSDIVKRGFKPTFLALWRGTEPNDVDRAMVADFCQQLQSEMLTWSRGGIETELRWQIDGTMRSLMLCYTHDPDSPFHKMRYASRANYIRFLSVIERDYGEAKLKELKARDMLRWHENWSERGVSMAHGLMRMTRGLLTFGMTILEDDDCARLSVTLSKMRFKMASARVERLTADMAIAIRELAHKKGLGSIALAQAIQFEGMLRQKDVIGEWVPLAEPGPALAQYRDQKWQRGLLWSEIDSSMVLRHMTSKRNKPIEIDLKLAPMVQEEFARIGKLPTFGPMIEYEVTRRPYNANHFRVLWRQIADECGVPATVRNQDSRAGAISEATDAGVDLEHIRHAATHSDIATTQRYSRGSVEKTANVLRLRVEHRNKGRT